MVTVSIKLLELGPNISPTWKYESTSAYADKETRHILQITPHLNNSTFSHSSIFKFRYQSLINNSINSRVVFVMPQNLIMESDHAEGSPCCFCFSSTKKSVVARNGKSSGVLSSEDVEWGKNDEMLSDRSTFSVKEQEKRLKKALEEEERVSKEAERVVQWVKQESARIDVSAIKSILSDNQKEPNLM